MRRASILPIAIMIGAVAAFLIVGYFALPWKVFHKCPLIGVQCQTGTEQYDNHQCLVRCSPITQNNTNTTANVNSVANTNTAVDSVADWKSYTNEKFGWSVQFPPTWVRRSEMSGSEMPLTSSDDMYLTVSDVGDHPTLLATISLADRTQGTFVHPNTFQYWLIDKTTTFNEDVTLGTVKFHKVHVANDTQEYYIVEHGATFFVFTFDHQDTDLASSILSTFTFAKPSETLVDLHDQFPIKKVTELQPLLGTVGVNGISAVSIMGDSALVGVSGGKLYLYKDQAMTDISDKIDTKISGLNPGYIIVRGIGTNGKYWLISTARSGEYDHLYRYDGKTWSDLSIDYHNAIGDGGTGGAQALTWNGKYWLIGDNAGRVTKFDGTSFTDLTSQLPYKLGEAIVDEIHWNDKYFLIVNTLLPSNNGQVLKFDGSSFTPITTFSSSNMLQAAGWNGSYWLLGGNDNQHILKYSGTTVTDLSISTDPFLKIVWLKPYWLLNGTFSDGKTTDGQTPIGRTGVTAISLGKTFGLIGTLSGSLTRFDY